MSEQTPGSGEETTDASDPRVVIVGSDGRAISAVAGGEDDQRGLADLVEQPAKVMRIGSMIRQLLEEVKSTPLDEAGRTRLADVIHTSIDELKDGLAPELDEELTRLVAPFDSGTPGESELRIAHAQLVGWLEGLFHGIQTAIYAQQMAARAQLEAMRRALPPGSHPAGMGMGHEGEGEQPPSGPSGMYL